MRILLLCLIWCLIADRLTAQLADSNVIELSGLRSFDRSESKFLFLSLPRDSLADDNIAKLHFAYPFPWHGIPDVLMERDCYMKFTIHNGDDSLRKVYFFPGYYLKSFRVFSADPENLLASFGPVLRDTQASKLYSACTLLSVRPHETKVYFARFRFLRTQINDYDPAVMDKDFLWTWVMLTRKRMEYLNIATYLASGIMLLMIFYSLAVYAQNRHREFVYYSAYAFCSGILLFLKSFLDFQPTAFNLFFEEYLDLMIICTGVFFYLAFIRKFLNTGVREPFLEMMLRLAGTALFVLVVVYSYIYFFTDKYIVLNILENYVMKLLIFVTGIIVIVYSFKKKDPLMNYIAAGNIALIFFSVISLCMLLFKWRFVPHPSILNRSLFYYEIGLISELGLFLFGLAYKNKIDIIAQVREREQYKLEAERKEFDKQMAMMAVRQEERDRISADMHDDLGSGVTAIRLMSEIVKSKMNTEQFPEIDKISSSANELLGKMNSIIWTMKSSNDTLESLVAYLRAYATEYFDGTTVDCSVEVENISEREMSGEKRRNIFLSFKETLNNILKHAHATMVKIKMSADENKLRIVIHDNGVGIDLKNIRRFGNGLNNIKKRMQSIDGDFVIGHDNGTIVCFEVMLASD